MEDTAHRAIAIVVVGALLPDARDTAAFWENVIRGRYSITEVPTERWDPELYYDADPKAPDKTYSKIGGWVRDCEWDPIRWRLPIPPKVADAMDGSQRWAISCARAARKAASRAAPCGGKYSRRSQSSHSEARAGSSVSDSTAGTASAGARPAR